MFDKSQLVGIVGTMKVDAAKAFYETTLGLKFLRDDGFALIFDVGGAELRVSRVPAVTPAAYSVLGFHVSDIAAEADRLARAGVPMERYGFLPQDERGVWTAQDGTKVAWFRDPDLNLLSMVQRV